jgi:hypothetical protein
MTITLLEVPLLALVLSYISKYSGEDAYIFGLNKNYPVFLFMAIIVALFVGLTISAEEIFRDRKILEREKFLNVSRASYLFSKISFLFFISAVQSFSFVLVANTLLEVKGMLIQQWFILFSTACFGNMLGLNISAGMRTAVSIYILIPLLLVPMLLLGGAMIKFDDLHRSISRKIYVPVIGDAMVTRWAYEALMVEEFKSNKFEKPFFKYDMEKSQTDWYTAFLLPTLKLKLEQCKVLSKNPDYQEDSRKNFRKINYHLKELSVEAHLIPGSWISDLNNEKFNDNIASRVKQFIDTLTLTLRTRNKIISDRRDSLVTVIKNRLGDAEFQKLQDANYNESLANIVLNRLNINKIYDADKKLIQKADPVLMKPGSKYGRAHFYAPYKQLGNLRIDTLLFNIAAIWIMTITLFITLYYNVLKQFIVLLESLKLPIWRKFGRELPQVLK